MSLARMPSDELAAGLLAPMIRTPSLGDLPRPVNLLDETGRGLTIADDVLAGGYLVLVFVADLAAPSAIAELRGYVARASAFDRLSAKIVVVTASTDAGTVRAEKARLGLPFPFLCDAGGTAFAGYGLKKRPDSRSPVAVRSVILTPYRQVRAVWDDGTMSDHAERAEALIAKSALADELSWRPPHAPVLVIPQVFSLDECKELIARFETVGELILDKEPLRGATEDFKTPVYEYGRQDRVDHYVRNPDAIGRIDGRLVERVFPMIRQAFAYEVTRREDLTIARYVGKRSGVAIGHRDNRSETTRHRRFALSLNLNDDYEGGEMVFREYSNRGYRNPPGAALVFSSSLLHEVQEIASGVRYALISHFFSDRETRR